MAMTPLPTAPSSNDPGTFNSRADALVAALPGFVTEANALEANVVAKEASATASASAAAASATTAAGGAGAAAWSSGTYSTGAAVWSPINYQTYRAKTTGSKPTDPSLDPTNWAPVTVGNSLPRIVQSADPGTNAAPYQEWIDTTNSLLKQRNAAGTDWIVLGTSAGLGVQTGSQTFAAAGGTVNAITATFSPPVTAYTNGMILTVESAGANTTAGVTFAANGLAAKSLYKGSNAALAIGDIGGANWSIRLRYDSSLDKFELMNPIQRAATNTTEGTVFVTSAGSITADRGSSKAVRAADLFNLQNTQHFSSSISGLSAVDFLTPANGLEDNVRIAISNLSTSGTSGLQILVGTGGVFSTSGYNSASSRIGAAAVVSAASTSGVGITNNLAADFVSGWIDFSHNTNLADTWNYSGVFSTSVGTVTVAGTCPYGEDFRIKSTNGTDTFDSGEITLTRR